MRKKELLATLCGICLILLVVELTFMTACTQPAAEREKPEDFYRGKTIDFTICDGPGGGIDLASRLIAPYLQQHTGATIVPTNRREAGGVEGLMYEYRSTPNGLAIAMGGSLVLALNKIMGAAGSDYKPEQFGYILSLSQQPHIFCVAAKGRYQSVSDLKSAKNLKLGGTSPEGNISLATMSVADLLDLDAKVVVGSSGTAPLTLSLLQGEIAGAALPVGPAMREITKGNFKGLFTIATRKFPVSPDIPALTELVPLKGEKEKLLKIWENELLMTFPVFTTPGVSEEKIAFLRKLTDKLMKSPQLRKDLVNVWYELDDSEFISGKDVGNIMQSTMSKAKDLQQIFKQLIERYRA